MISGRGLFDGKTVLVLGLTLEEVEMLRKDPLIATMSVEGSSVDLPEVDEILIVFGENEAAFMEAMQCGIDEHTVIRGMPKDMKN